MTLLIRTHLCYATTQPCDLLLQIEAQTDHAQASTRVRLDFDADTRVYEVEAGPGVGARQWIRAGAQFECTYEARVDITRPNVDLTNLAETPLRHIPGDVIVYLMPSRYCHPEVFLDFVAVQFEGLTGGALIVAFRDWINSNFTYDINASYPGTTASDSFACLAGVCRDYAHVLITFARAAGIPARYVSVYAPDVVPQDFHAVAEVYLDGAWHLVDPTGMANPAETARIWTGRDAADTSFITSYGFMELKAQSIEVTRLA